MRNSVIFMPVVIGTIAFIIAGNISASERGINIVKEQGISASSLDEATSIMLLHEGIYRLPNLENGTPQGPYKFTDGAYFEQGPLGATDITNLKIASYTLAEKGNFDQYFVWIRETTGGTGVFSHVALATYSPAVKQFTSPNAVFIGDRVNEVTAELVGDMVHIHYLTRREDEPLAFPPTLPATIIVPLSDLMR